MTGEALTISLMICKELGIGIDQLLSKSRKRAIIDARFLCVYFLKKRIDHVTLKSLGIWFGKKDNGSAHSFAFYALKQTEKLSTTNAKFKEKYNLCSNLLGYEMDFNNIPQY